MQKDLSNFLQIFPPLCRERLVLSVQPLQLNVHSLPPHIKKDSSEPRPFQLQEPCSITFKTPKRRGHGYVASERPSQQSTSVRTTAESAKNIPDFYV